MASAGRSDDLGYCQGSHQAKVAILDSKCQSALRPQQQSNPDLRLLKPEAVPVRRTHSEDIKERVQLLEKAMAGKANYSRGAKHVLDKSDPEYGTPEKGSQTALRGQKAHKHVHKVVQIHEYDR